VAEVRRRRAAYADRKANVFSAAIAAGRSWSAAYYGARGRDEAFPIIDGATRASLTLTSDGVAYQTYQPPPGCALVEACAIEDSSGSLVLFMAVGTPGGNRQLVVHADTDMDGLPQVSPTQPPLGLAPAAGLAPIDSLLLIADAPQAVCGPFGGLLLCDTLDGRVQALALDAAALPTAPPITLFAHPALTSSGGFVHFAGMTTPSAGITRLLFSTRAPSSQYGGAPAVWFDVNGAGTLVASAAGAGLTLAGGRAPFNLLGIESMEGGAGFVTFDGNPGAIVAFEAIGHGAVVPLGVATTGTGGQSANLTLAAPLAGNELYRATAGAATAVGFVARVGIGIDDVANDENGDGALDRIDLSAAPARLHLLAGSAAAPTSAVRDHLMEIALEAAAETIESWDDANGRVLSAAGSPRTLARIASTNPPVYAQSVHDFDGDNLARETLVLARPSSTGLWEARFYANALSAAPGLTQTLLLPPGFEPAGVSFRDLTGDGSLDVCIAGTEPFSETLLSNQGAGTFTVASQLFPGSGEDFIMLLGVNGSLSPCRDVVDVAAGDYLEIHVASPSLTFVHEPIIIACQFFTPGLPPASPPFFPELYLNPGLIPAPILLISPLDLVLGVSPTLMPFGNTYGFVIPQSPFLPGSVTMMQALVVAPAAGNGFFATSDGAVLAFE
jgi:hypothetical protein